MCLPSSCHLKFAVTFTMFDKMQEKEVPINQDIKWCEWCSLFWRHDTQKGQSLSQLTSVVCSVGCG